VTKAWRPFWIVIIQYDGDEVTYKLKGSIEIIQEKNELRLKYNVNGFQPKSNLTKK
jgi:hypothetical protein